jgi:hypothetical protein
MEVPLGDTYYFLFTTRQYSDGAPTTLSGTPALSVYEENNLTQIITGVAVSADYDTVTGLNECSIVASGANGYEAGKYYSVVITTGTVGGTSVVGEVIGHFRVMPAEDAGAGIKDVNVTHLGDTLQTAGDVGGDVAAILVDTGTTLDTKLDDIQGATFSSATDSLEAIRDRGDAAWTGSPITSDSGTAQAGSATTITLRNGAPAAVANQLNGQVIYISSGTGAGQSRAIKSYDVTTPTAPVATVISNWAINPDATSVYEIYPDEITEITPAPTADAIADAVWDENTTGHTQASTFGEQVKNDIDAILTDTSSTLDGKLNTAQADLDILTGSDGVTLATAQANYAPATAAALTTVEGKVDTVDTVVDGIQTDLSNATDGLGALSADIAAVQTDVTTLTGTDGATLATSQPNYAPATAAALTTVDTNIDNLNLGIIYGTSVTGTLSTTVSTTDLTGYLDNELIGRVIIWTGGTADGQAAEITGYSATGGTVTYGDGITTAPANTDPFKIV